MNTLVAIAFIPMWGAAMHDYTPADSGEEARIDPKRGRLSRDDRQRMFEMEQAGYDDDAIAEELQRTTGLVRRTLEHRQPAPRDSRKKPKPSRPQQVPAAPAPARRRSPKASDTLTHRYWLRPSVQVELALPADLHEGEAERLAEFVQRLCFSSPLSGPRPSRL